MPTAVINPAPGTSVLAASTLAAFKAVNLALATPKVHVDNGAAGDAAYTITAANGAGTTAALYKLTKDIICAIQRHCQDNTGIGPSGSAAHKEVDSSAEYLAIPAPSTVVSLATAYTALNAITAWKTAHCPSTTYHGAADSTYSVTSAAAATTQGT
jgi:hypothetical protein